MAFKKIAAGSIVTMGILIAASRVQAVPVQWTGPGSNGHWYEVIESQVDWATANANAASSSFEVAPGVFETGYLATITSAEENDFVTSLFTIPADAFPNGYWLGGIQATPNPPDQGWSWITGEAWDYTNWGALQPSDSGGDEDRLSLIGSDSSSSVGLGFWNDELGTRTANMAGYVVEYVPEPSVALILTSVLATLIATRRRFGTK